MLEKVNKKIYYYINTGNKLNIGIKVMLVLGAKQVTKEFINIVQLTIDNELSIR